MTRLQKVLLGLGASLLVAGGASATWYYRDQLFPRDPGVFGEASALIPDNTLMATFVTADAQTWTEFDQFGIDQAATLISANLQDFALMAPVFASQSHLWQQLTKIGVPETQVLISEHLRDFKDSLSLGSLSYEENLEPWVKTMAVSILPPTEVRSTGKMNVLLILGMSDPAKVKEFTQAVQSQPAVQVQTIAYQSKQILEVVPKASGQEPTYIAAVGDYLLFSPERRSIELSIEASQNQGSLKTTAKDAVTLTSDLNLENPIAQVFVPNYANLVNQILVASDGTAPLSQESLQQFQAVGSVAAGVSLEEKGLRFRVMVQKGSEATTEPFRTTANKVLGFLPENTLAVVNGQDLKAMWSDFAGSSPEASENLGKGVLPPLAPFDFGLDLDVNKDLLSWMTGEFALGIVPVKQELMSQLGLSGVLVLETSDRATTEATLAKLDQQAQKTKLTIDKQASGKNVVTQWRLPQGLFLDPFQNEVLLGYGWRSSNVLFVALGGALVDAMTDAQSLSLKDNPTFQTVIQALPARNSGYFYLNLEALDTLNTLNQQMENLPTDTQPVVASVQSLGVTTSQYDRQTNQVDLFMLLKDNPQQPTPSPSPSSAPPALAPSPSLQENPDAPEDQPQGEG